jgi:hypothetical protein
MWSVHAWTLHKGRSVLCGIIHYRQQRSQVRGAMSDTEIAAKVFEFTELVEIESKYLENRLLRRDRRQQQLHHEHAFLETGAKETL